MKFFHFIIVLLTAGMFFSSCQKEYSAENGNSVGSLQSNATGDCMPILVNGTYIKDTALKTSNYIEVQVNFSQSGAYLIKTDTINGYSFTGSGAVSVAGVSTVRLQGFGKPIGPSAADIFQVKYQTSACEVSVPVTGSGGGGGGTSVFTLGGAGSTCTGVVLAGTYTAGSAVTASNTVTLDINVTTLGTYNLSTSANNVTFSGTGTFTTTGPQTVILTASGTPATPGPTNYSISAGSGSCTFNVTYVQATPAVYTFSGSPGACAVATVNGAYGVNLPLTSANTVNIQVNVQSIGSYTISTNSVNGMSFSKTGNFSNTGIQTVTLTGIGNPTTAGSNMLTVGTGGCTFSVTVLGPSSYTFSGAPGACTIATINGVYRVNTPLISSNTVDVQVNVTATGTYSISTAAGGMTFSTSGAFNTTGIQTVTLTGSGTPTTLGPNNFTVGSGGCSFAVNVLAATSPCTGLVAGTFAIAGQFTISGIDFETSLGNQYQVSIQQGFIKMDVFFPGGNRPIPGTYNVGTVQITCPDANFISNARIWNATSGQVYVSIDANSEMTVEFCNVPFAGTSALGGPTLNSTGSGKTVTQ